MKFPDTITRRRQEPGSRDMYGTFIDGAITEVDLRASVQPLLLDDSDTAGGAVFTHRLKIYVSQPDALRAAFEDREADVCVVDTLDYIVEESQSWRGSHTKAIVLRQN